MSDTLHIDLETYSSIPIGYGVYKYAEKVEILLFAWAVNDGPVKVWDVANDLSGPMRAILVADAKRCDIVIAHNCNFERTVLSAVGGFSYLLEKQWRDTMARAFSHSLPGALGKLSVIFALPKDKAKDKDGKELINLFCKPQKDTFIKKYGTNRATRKTHPEEWAKFIEYVKLDVEAERALDKKLPRWNDTEYEQQLFDLDRKINGRGFAVDLRLCEAAIAAVKKEQAENKVLTSEATHGEVASATQRDKLLKYILNIHGVSLPDMQLSTLTRRLEDPDLPEPVKDLIRLRLASAGTSTTKYQVFLDATGEDGRLRGTIQFRGAKRTGRASGRIIQPQNYPNPLVDKWELAIGIDALKGEYADVIWDNVTEIASSAIRSVTIAGPGKKLVVSDLKSIEGRVIAYLAGEEWKLKAYKDVDDGVIKHDMYELTYASTFQVNPDSVDSKQRKLGKTLDLALGFGGGVGSMITFAVNFNIDLDEVADLVWHTLSADVISEAENYWDNGGEERGYGLSKRTFCSLDSIKRLWRRSNPCIASLWRNMEDGVRFVLNNPTKVYTYNCLSIDKAGAYVRVKLPSGRYLTYPGMAVDDSGKLTFYGEHQYTKKWCRLSTYGGKLAQNTTQAMANDVLNKGMLLAEEAGYGVIMQVHDELITEAPDTKEYSAEGLSKIMSIVPAWAPGLPLNAAGFESYRYRKD